MWEILKIVFWLGAGFVGLIAFGGASYENKMIGLMLAQLAFLYNISRNVASSASASAKIHYMLSKKVFREHHDNDAA